MRGRILVNKQNFKNQLQKLSNIATKCKFKIEISQNNLVINAKSLIGLLVLNYDKPVDITCKTEDIKEKEKFFSKVKNIFTPEKDI